LGLVPQSRREPTDTLARAVENIQRAKSRTQAAFRLVGDLRMNVDARQSATVAKTHLTALNDTRCALRRIAALQAKVTAPVAVAAWESKAQAYLELADNLARSTDEVIAALVAHR
jgi:hypothetical protein